MKYVIVNDLHPCRPYVADEESEVYVDRLSAEKEARELRQYCANPGIRVYELKEPGTLLTLSEEDVFKMARRKRLPKKMVKAKMELIRKLIEEGFSDWPEVVSSAIDVALKDQY